MTNRENRSGTITREIVLDGNDICELFAKAGIDAASVKFVSVGSESNGSHPQHYRELCLGVERLVLSFRTPAKEVR